MARLSSVPRCGRAVAAAAILACASATPAPDWLGERPAPYRDERWLVAVAAGATAAQAEDTALAKIAEQTDGVTSGAVIADTWVDRKKGLHWALAVLDREPLRSRTEEELARVEGEIRAARDRVPGVPPEEGLREILHALSLLGKRDVLGRRLALLGGPALPEVNALDASLQAELAEIKQNLPIEITALSVDPVTGAIGEPVDELRRALAQRVTELGFPVSTRSWGWQDDPSWILVELHLGLDPLVLPDRDRLVAVHWDAALEIADAEGKLIAVLTEEGRSTHVSESEARRQAREAAEAFAVTALDDWMSSRITPKATAAP